MFGVKGGDIFLFTYIYLSDIRVRTKTGVLECHRKRRNHKFKDKSTIGHTETPIRRTLVRNKGVLTDRVIDLYKSLKDRFKN